MAIPHTLINDWNLMAVVDELWQCAQIVLSRQLLVVDLDETDFQLIRLVVNVFQFLQCFLALFALGFVCKLVRLEWSATSLSQIESDRAGLSEEGIQLMGMDVGGCVRAEIESIN